MKNTDKWVIEYPNHFETTWCPSILSDGRNKDATFEKVIDVMTVAVVQKSFDNLQKYRLRNVVTGEVILWETLSVILTSSPENM